MKYLNFPSKKSNNFHAKIPNILTEKFKWKFEKKWDLFLRFSNTVQSAAPLGQQT